MEPYDPDYPQYDPRDESQLISYKDPALQKENEISCSETFSPIEAFAKEVAAYALAFKSDQTGAERYFSGRLEDVEYRKVYDNVAAEEASRLLKIASDNTIVAKEILKIAETAFDLALSQYRESIIFLEESEDVEAFDESMAEDGDNIPFYAWGDEERQ